jgi:hypothetical protein
MSARSQIVVGIALGLLVGVVGSLAAVRLSAPDDPPAAARQAATAATAYPGDAELESRLVQLESQRLVYVRTVASTAHWNPAIAAGPFRVQTGSGYTLVLPARQDPYTLADLVALAPDTFRADDDGYLLSESIVVLAGATLALRPPDDSDGLRIRMASDPNSFVSIVTSGGQLRVEGRDGAPVEFDSWDAQLAAADTETADGRAYLRVIGGRAAIAHASFADLGFWSGTTGGLALTGTNDSADFDALLAEREADEQREATARDEGAAASAPAGSAVLSETLAHRVPASAAAPDAAPDAAPESETQETASQAPAQPQPVGGAQTVPATANPEFPTGVGPEPANATPGEPTAAPAASSLVKARLDHVTIRGNAFGLFATSASGVVIRDSSISKSLIDGLVFHRHVTGSAVTRTTSTDNAVDGFSLARSSTDVSFTDVTARGNGRDGLALDGQPLASGPSATGTKVQEFGGNRVTRSQLVDNGRYGIAVSGGRGITVSSNVVRGNESGIVVDKHAADVQIVANRLAGQSRQAIALRDGVSAEVVTNRITGGDTAVYLRNAAAAVQNNTIARVSNHGVTLVGDAGDAEVERNTIAGFGSIPIYDERSTGGTVLHNDTVHWRPAPSIDTVVNALFQPLTLVWIVLGLLVLGTAISPAGRRATTIRHPYAERAPLSTFTKGIVSRESIREVHR